MSRVLMLTLALALSLALQPAYGQGLGMPMGSLWDTYVTLTRTDLDVIRTALTQQIHNKRRGTSVIWKNPDSGNSGTVTLLDASTRQGYRCERIEYRMSPPQGSPSDRFVLTSCMQPDGSWKLAS
jgi:surface antigen